MIRVLVTEKVDNDALSLLKEQKSIDFSIKYTMTDKELQSKIPNYDAIIIRTYTKMTKDVIDSAKNLKLIVRAGVGLDNIDTAYAKEKKITVKNTPKANYISVAEHVFALMLSLYRNITLADKYIRAENGWDRKKFIGSELNGKTLGIIGLGLIGSQVARFAKLFGMRIIAYDPFISKDSMKKMDAEKRQNLIDIAQESDIISLHIPLTDATRRMIGNDFTSKMKKTAIIINTSRGPVIDEDALINALKHRKIRGAALDVFETEPIINKRFLSLDNVILTPHLGAMTEEADKRMCVDAAKEVISFFN